MKPSIEERPAQPYVGLRKTMSMDAFDTEIPALIEKLSAQLEANNVKPTGKPFLRYYVIDMPKRLEVELGIPVESAPDSLPAGRYAVTTYKGVKNGIPENKKLMAWATEHGEAVVREDTDKGEEYEARYETFLSAAGTAPDEMETQIAMKLR